MSRDSIDLYATLGVKPTATPDDIEAAFKAGRQDPATGHDLTGESWERFRYAYEVLSDSRRRSLYDSLLAETAPLALKTDIVLSATRLPLLDEPQLLYVLVTVSSIESQAAFRQPLNLTLVVDRSTSMRGERLETVIRAVGLLLDKLGPEDSLAVVSFSDRAEVVLPAHRRGALPETSDTAVATARQNPLARLEALAASGGTEIYQGLKEGVAQTRRMAAGRNSHLILLTDGHTYGDAAECLKLAEEVAAEGIDMTAFGIGADWNDQFLDALVAPSGGQSGFIEQPEDLLPLLENRLTGLAAAYGRNVTLLPNWPSQLRLRSGFKLSPFAQPMVVSEDAIPLGNLEGRSPLAFILEFQVAPQSIPARIRLPLEIRYRVSDESGQFLALQQTAQLVVDRGETGGDPPPALIEAARRMTLYQLQERVYAEVQSGQLDAAGERMRRLTARYLETGDLRLAQQAQLESQRLAHTGLISSAGRKVLKYGTRSLRGGLDS